MSELNKALAVINEVQKAVVGKNDVIEKIMAAIIAQGHILIEDMPGVGKTTMAKAFSKAMGIKDSRVQFTPDIMPSDLTGFSIYKKETGQFVYKPGALMCNMFLADEINRTSPKTQSALLEVMEERQITVDGITREMGNPFVVIATENPEGSAGTQMLPESQLDRFMICVNMGYPTVEEEMEILKRRQMGNPLEYVNNEKEIHYDITSKTAIKDMFAVHLASAKNLRQFVEDMKSLSDELGKYLIGMECVILDTEFIFFNRNTKRYEFCLLPFFENDMYGGIRNIYEKILELIDYDDKDAVVMAYEIQQVTNNKDFTMVDILNCTKVEAQSEVHRKDNEIQETRVNQNIDEYQDKTPEKKRWFEGIFSSFRRKSNYLSSEQLEQIAVSEEENIYNFNGDEVAEEEDNYYETTVLYEETIILRSLEQKDMLIHPDKFPFLIGKSRLKCDYVIDQNVISRVHAKIIKKNNTFFIEDMDSTNKTFINGKKLEPGRKEKISKGDKITLADMDFIVE